MLSEQSSLQQKQHSKEIKLLNKELTSIDMQITNTISLVTNGSVLFDTVKDSIDTLEERKAYVTRQLEALAFELNDISISLQTVGSLIEQSKEFLLTRNIAECRKFMASYIHTVIITNADIQLTLKIPFINENNEIVNYSSTITRQELYSKYKPLLQKKAI